MTLSQYVIQQQLTSARVVSTTNLSANYYNGPGQNGVKATLTAASVGALTIDSVTVIAGDRVLVQGQSAGLQNGIYDVTDPGSSSSQFILTRSSDFHCIEQMKPGQYITISAGSTRKGSIYVLTEPLPAQLGVNTLTFTEASIGVALGTAATKDASDNAEPIVSSVVTPTVVGNFASFSDVGGTIEDTGISASDATEPKVASVSGATVVTHVAAFVDTAGTIGDSGIPEGDVQLRTNIHATRSTDIGGLGAGPINVPHAGITANSIVTATINTSSNAVAVAKTTAAVDSFDITFTADPGAACLVNYVVFIQAQ